MVVSVGRCTHLCVVSASVWVGVPVCVGGVFFGSTYDIKVSQEPNELFSFLFPRAHTYVVRCNSSIQSVHNNTLQNLFLFLQL